MDVDAGASGMAAMTNENVVMVAERALGQLIADLPGELEVKVRDIEELISLRDSRRGRTLFMMHVHLFVDAASYSKMHVFLFVDAASYS